MQKQTYRTSWINIERGLAVIMIWLTLILFFGQALRLPTMLRNTLTDQEWMLFNLGTLYTLVIVMILVILSVMVWILVYADVMSPLKKLKEIVKET
jgi:hypothetical protein